MIISLNPTRVKGFVLTHQLITMLMVSVWISHRVASIYSLVGVKVGILGLNPLTKQVLSLMCNLCTWVNKQTSEISPDQHTVRGLTSACTVSGPLGTDLIEQTGMEHEQAQV